jgi:peptidase M28-like protein/PDZ domain-containing protein/PA domain-containing protein
MKRILLVALVLSTSVSAQQPAVASRTRAPVEFLASDRLEGRDTGSPGERMAGDYIAMQLARAGAKPLPGHRDMFAPFDFTAGTRDGGSTLTLRGNDSSTQAFRGADQVQALSFSDDAMVSAPVVFAGYGLAVPESQNFGYDSYAGLDVKDKIVLVLHYFPEDTDAKTKAALARYSDLRYKALAARQRGAKGLLIVIGPRSPNAGQTLRMTSDTALSGSGIPAATISATVANALFAGAPKPLAAAQEELDSGNPHVGGFALPSSVDLTTKVVREKQTGRNVIAYLPANPQSPSTSLGASRGANSGDKPWLIVGAHYDHLGHGTRGTSLANKDEAGQIHHGADDNASGTAAVLAIAEALTKQPMRRRNIMFTLWSGEEIGLVGSNAFITNPPIPLTDVGAYLNFDMVGRMQNNRLAVDGTGSSEIWPRILERANVAAGFDLNTSPDPYQPTDSSTFNQAGVPTLFFTTGSHPDYHRPSDTADKINYEDLERVVDFATAVIQAVANIDMPPAFTKVDPPQTGATLAGVRVTTGTIPDYTTEAKGLLLAGVVGGGPAERAGLMKGDIIVEIAGQSITNIYDYTFALELLKPDMPVKVVFTRNGQRHEVELTPAGRR